MIRHGEFFGCRVTENSLTRVGKTAGTRPVDISRYLHQLSSRTVNLGHVVFKEGQEGDGYMYFVIEGEVPFTLPARIRSSR